MELTHTSLHWDQTPSTLHKSLRGRVWALGNFDGFHQGHQRLVSLAHRVADRQGCRPATLLTFAPHPARVLRPEKKILSITTRVHFEALLGEVGGLRDWASLRFDELLAQKNGGEFLAWLHQNLAPAGLCVGYNFSFGREKGSTTDDLLRWGKKMGLEVEVLPPFEVDGQVVSSTRARERIVAGDFSRVSKLLGRPYSIRDLVVTGEKRGRLLGFPTINFEVRDLALPSEGVYATSTYVFAGNEKKRFRSVSHLGRAETFGAGLPVKLETHLIDFEGDLYGRQAEVVFHRKIRDNQRFSSLEELKMAIEQDRQTRIADSETWAGDLEEKS